jgi:hypothetical protein
LYGVEPDQSLRLILILRYVCGVDTNEVGFDDCDIWLEVAPRVQG